jgi:hypothetical protein
MSIVTLRALLASFPESSVETFFHALRMAGWTPDDDAVTAATPVSPDSSTHPADPDRKVAR